MASDPRTIEALCNSATDEETVAFRKKRLRRVSFADIEITSVHVFDRDEDLETPPTDALTKNQTPENAHEPPNEVLGFFKELADGDDLKEASFSGDEGAHEDEAVCARSSFLRPFESPGSSVPGSATSNDGDEFFGPVSADFIRPRRLSDSSASIDNHEMTMDSTAFSMHFRSLVRSESGDLRTPTNVGFGFAEKSPSNMATPSDPESLMSFTNAMKPQLFSDPGDKSSGCVHSDAMSLIGENARSYDYGKLSPNLEAILGEDSKELHSLLVPGLTRPNLLKRNESPLQFENRSRHINQNDSEDKALERVSLLDEPAEMVSADLLEADKAHGVSVVDHGDQNNGFHSPSRNDCFPTSMSSHEPVDSLSHLAELNTPDQLHQLQENKSSTDAVSGQSIHAEFSDVTPSKTSNVLQIECARNLKESTQKITSPEDKSGNLSVARNEEESCRSLSTAPSVKQQPMFNHDAKSFSTLSYVTPSPKQTRASSIKESRKSAEIISSVHESSSRLKETIEKSIFLLSELNSSMHSRMSPLKENSKNVIGVSVAKLEEHFSAVDTKSTPDQSTRYMQTDLSKSFGCFDNFMNLKVTPCLAENEESLVHVSPSRVSKEKPTQPVSEPSEFLSPKLKMDHESDAEKPTQPVSEPSDFLSPKLKMDQESDAEKPTQPVSEPSDFLSPKLKMDHESDAKSIDADDKFASPLTKRSPHKLSSLENSSSLPCYSKQQCVQFTDIATHDLELDADLMGDAASNTHTTGITSELESWFDERNSKSSSPLFVVNRFDDFSLMKTVNDKEQQVDQANTEDVSLSAASIQVPAREIGFSSHQGTPNGNGLIAAFKQSKISVEESKASANATGHTIKPSRMKSPCKEALTTNHTRDEPEMILTPNSKSNWGKISKIHDGFQNAESPTLLGEVENGSLRKRKIEVARGYPTRSSRIKLDGILSPICNTKRLRKGNKPFHISHSPTVASDFDSTDICEEQNGREREGATNNTCMIRSPNTQATNVSSLGDGLELGSGCDEVRMTGGDTTTKHWRDISQKLSADTKDLLSPSVGALKIKSIYMIQDILDHLQKLKIRQMFCLQIQQQKVCDQTSKRIYDRTAEMRNVICKLVFEKARVQLLTAKLQKFLKRRKILNIAVQELQMLKAAKALCLPVPSVVKPANDSCQNSFHSIDKASHVKLVASRHEFEALQEKLKNLTQYFRSCSKIERETSYSEIIGMLNCRLNKKVTCRFLHEGIQLYEIQDLENRNGIISILLSYLDFFCQRFTIKATQISSLSLSVKLNEAKITTNFPNMDACAAFSYVLNMDTTKKYAGARSLAQETRRTSLLLQNLLDVAQELQIARIEATNLVDISFSSSVEQLDLQLCFVDVGSHTKMNVMLDMTCLKDGIYPGDILPYRIQASCGGMQRSHMESLPAQVKAAVDGVRVGHSRILRICRSISQLMSL